jgi:hypothetical protein
MELLFVTMGNSSALRPLLPRLREPDTAESSSSSTFASTTSVAVKPTPTLVGLALPAAVLLLPPAAVVITRTSDVDAAVLTRGPGRGISAGAERGIPSMGAAAGVVADSSSSSSSGAALAPFSGVEAADEGDGTWDGLFFFSPSTAPST